MFGLLGLWLGATNHCKLEEIPGLNFLVCCDHEAGAPHQDEDCDNDTCAQVEDGLYKTEDSKVAALPPGLLLVGCLSPAAEERSPSRFQIVGFCTIAPPELPVTWQFSSRTALPPRAPSIAS